MSRWLFHVRFGFVAAALCFPGCGRQALATAKDARAVCFEMADDGRSFRVTAPGLTDFQAGWSAAIERDGQQMVLSSSEGRVSPGAVTTNHFPEAGIDLLFRLESAPGNVGVLAQAGIRNTGQGPVNLVALTPVAAEFRTPDNPAEWLVTGVHPLTPVMTSLDVLRGPIRVHEYGGLYRRDGAGFLFGPAGEPTAYINAQFAPARDGRTELWLWAEMSHVRVDPGETRWGQQVALVMEKPQAALAHWAGWVVESHGARTEKGSLSGWNNWNFLQKEDPGQEVVAVTEAVRASGGRLRPDVVQVDAFEDPFRDAVLRAPWVPDCAHRVAVVGARFGMFLAFDPSRGPAGFTDRASSAVRQGATYLKAHFPMAHVRRDAKRTMFEVYRDDYMALRGAVGMDTYLLHCDYRPNRAVLGLADASRVGGDAMRHNLRSVMNDALRSYPLSRRWFAVDCDTYFIGTDIGNISGVTGGWPVVRTWLSMVGLSCGAAITSDPWYWESFKPYWRNVEVMTPPAAEQTEVLDLCTGREWPRLVGHVRRDWGDATVALLWNPGDKEQSIVLDFAQAGMDPNRRYAVWSFWDNLYLGVTKGKWTANQLAPSASQHLVFTDLERTPHRPVVIGSNLHIYCGAAELEHIDSRRGGLIIQLTDAGAREGDLFVYSRWMPILKAATGCTVSGVFSAGENVWRINVRDRQSGQSQRMELGLVLPVTHQVWFWLLIAWALAGLLFGGWRYVIGLRLQRAQVLVEERARIARDLHDEIGANLSHMSILSTLAAKPTTDAAVSRQHNLEVAGVARQTIRAFDEILWSINPKNDTLQSLSHYICRSAEEILTSAQATMQFTLDESFPDKAVPPRHRHGVLLAVKEALHNILKHAGASRVQVHCTMEGGAFVVRVADDGRGFDLQTVRADAGGRQGHGLENMRQRLTELGGACHLESQTGRGTSITFRLPLN
jgi:signal transduction histidine kinase